MTYNIGFTGTEKGMTDRQKSLVQTTLFTFRGDSFHHGDCVGADAEAHKIAKSLGYKIVVHPPLNPKSRAYCKGEEVRVRKEYLKRNHDIVDEIDVLLACPAEQNEVLRSGVWATVRYAKKKGKIVKIFYL